MGRQPILALTAGEPAGIGPDLCLQLAQEDHEPIVVVASRDLLAARVQTLGLQVTLRDWQPGEMPAVQAGELSLLHVDGCGPCQAGRTDPGNSQYVLDTLSVAARGCLDDTFDGMVTAPVHKAVINQAGIAFSGHTEFLQELCGVERVVMMLATGELRVALVTTHLP
ncbi:MAG TPA: 4-hydroxythreonine-4-phosphate dehydrogenase, partial [Marinobacter sp.]|nr:4-hydroxythreonine-4-phosphate dehydrogenase [Marinobacter sp.]